ncbi:conserved domain protein [Bacteroides clarus YIT 12056]|uniref:Conserved domain protein n=2 Tax=Bacteroides clarus TaxID=626929 RepID=A0ABP2KXA6_9BACE|nr:conserved domain protein [Bacteroides clarus YIT 12056]
MYILYICEYTKYYIMATAVLEKKRKNIDLPADVLQKLSVLAASQGKSLKAFIEHLLVAKANSISVEVSENPSPTSDPFFEDPDNRAEIEKRVKAHKAGEAKGAVTLRSTEEIEKFMNNL